MSAVAHDAAADGPTSARRRVSPETLVAAVVAAALLLAIATVAVTGGVVGGRALVTVPWLAGLTVPVLLVLTFLAELATVRIRRGDFFEGLTLIEAAAVANALLLPPAAALLVTGGALGVSHLLRRRDPLKVLFNVASTTLSTSVLVLALHLLAPASSSFDARLVVALLVGTAGFVTVNLVCVGTVVSTVTGARLVDFLREEARLSALMAVGSVAVTATALSAATVAPALVPFSGMPAAALVYAYRAAATQGKERERSAHVLRFSETLASAGSQDDAVDAFLTLARDAFPVVSATAVLGEGTSGQLHGSALPTSHLLRFSAREAHAPALVHDGLPDGWAEAAVAPLEAGGRRVGLVVLGAARRGAFSTDDLTLLASLCSALGAAWSSAAHLGDLVEETAKLKAVIEQSSDGILVLDGDGRVKLWNSTMTAVTGHEEDAALGVPLADVLAVARTSERAGEEGGAPASERLGRSFLTPAEPRSVEELAVLRADGEPRTLRFAHSGMFAEDGRLVQDVVTVHDLTRQRQVDRLKADFIATVSHELRTPVTPIKGFADLLRRRGEEMTPEKRRRCVDMISERADHLSRLVEDLLVASRIGDDRAPVHELSITECDLVPLLERTVTDFAQHRSRLTLVYDEPRMLVKGDVTRLVQVVTNLVSNGLKYSGEQAPVEVMLARSSTHAVITVTDAGRGIPADQLEQVFEKFHRVEDPMVMTTGGTGLGLFIARSLARGMSGDLTLRSTLGAGSTFTFTVPLAAA